jgi:small subunit ribosomal protein S12
MPTFAQFSRGIRGIKKRKLRARWLLHHPQKKAVIVKLKTMTPRKPNSAIRRIAKVKIMSTGKKIQAFITGKGHNLQEHSVVMLRGGRANDLPGIHYKMIRGKYDLVPKEEFIRRRKRSRFSLKLPFHQRREYILEQKLLHKESVLEAKALGLTPPKYHRRMESLLGSPKDEKD